jgi:uncharacterized protein YqfB (UPF0267 family)
MKFSAGTPVRCYEYWTTQILAEIQKNAKATITLQRYLMIFDNHIPQPFFTVGQVRPMIAMLYPFDLIEQRL